MSEKSDERKAGKADVRQLMTLLKATLGYGLPSEFDDRVVVHDNDGQGLRIVIGGGLSVYDYLALGAAISDITHDRVICDGVAVGEAPDTVVIFLDLVVDPR